MFFHDSELIVCTNTYLLKKATLIFTFPYKVAVILHTCIISVPQQNRLQWYGHVLRKEDSDCAKKCMEHEVKGARLRGRPKKTWREIVDKDCQVHGLNREAALDRDRWRKLIRDD